MKVFKHPQFVSPGGIGIQGRELFLPRIARISRITGVFYPRDPRNPRFFLKTDLPFWPFPAGVVFANLLIFCLALSLSSANSEESTKGKSQQTIQTDWPARDSVPVKVTDDDGKPVRGAQITPEELGDSEFVVRWSDKDYGSPPTAKTDAEGVALVPYPIEVSKGIKTTRIFFAVDHPEFCLRHAVCFVVSNDLAQRGEPPVVLSRGAQLEVSGYVSKTKLPAAGMIPQIATTKAGLEMNRSCWKEAMPGVLQTSRLPPGLLRLRLVVMPLNSLASFSEVVELDLKPGESRKLKVQLNPGIRLEGKLDPAVPRPVLNGWASLAIVAARTEQPPTQNLQDRWAWFACERIREDGSFLFPSLPKGEAGLVAGCEGFLSTDPMNSGQNPPLGQEHFVHRNAHYVPLKKKIVKFTVPAEKTGTAEFKSLILQAGQSQERPWNFCPTGIGSIHTKCSDGMDTARQTRSGTKS